MFLLHRKAQTAGAAEVLKNPDMQKILFFFSKRLGISEILFVAMSELLGNDQVMNSRFTIQSTGLET